MAFGTGGSRGVLWLARVGGNPEPTRETIRMISVIIHVDRPVTGHSDQSHICASVRRVFSPALMQWATLGES